MNEESSQKAAIIKEAIPWDESIPLPNDVAIEPFFDALITHCRKQLHRVLANIMNEMIHSCDRTAKVLAYVWKKLEDINLQVSTDIERDIKEAMGSRGVVGRNL